MWRADVTGNRIEDEGKAREGEEREREERKGETNRMAVYFR